MARPKPNQITKAKNLMGKTKAVVRVGDITPFRLKQKLERDAFVDFHCRMHKQMEAFMRTQS